MKSLTVKVHKPGKKHIHPKRGSITDKNGADLGWISLNLFLLSYSTQAACFFTCFKFTTKIWPKTWRPFLWSENIFAGFKVDILKQRLGLGLWLGIDIGLGGWGINYVWESPEKIEIQQCVCIGEHVDSNVEMAQSASWVRSSDKRLKQQMSTKMRSSQSKSGRCAGQARSGPFWKCGCTSGAKEVHIAVLETQSSVCVNRYNTHRGHAAALRKLTFEGVYLHICSMPFYTGWQKKGHPALTPQLSSSS